MQERLAAAWETAGELQGRRSELMRGIQSTMRELRDLRERLRHEHGRARRRQRTEDPWRRLAARYGLTPRELEVALLLSGGAPNMVIADTLRISEHTARHHTRHVLVKLGLHSRARVMATIARELGAGLPPTAALAE